MDTVAALIEKIGPAALSGATSLSVQAISNMKQRGSIPVRHWPAILDLAKGIENLRDLDAEKLMRLHAPSSDEGQP